MAEVRPVRQPTPVQIERLSQNISHATRHIPKRVPDAGADVVNRLRLRQRRAERSFDEGFGHILHKNKVAHLPAFGQCKPSAG